MMEWRDEGVEWSLGENDKRWVDMKDSCDEMRTKSKCKNENRFPL